jgi:putative DNA-binding protein
MAARILGSASSNLVGSGSILDAWLHVPAPERADERLRVYSGGYPARVHDSLAETYPALAHVVGEPAFVALAHRYAASVPLSSYNLNDAGAQMHAFVRDDVLSGDFPYLPDLAELEWRVACAFHARERSPLDPRALHWSVDQWANAVLQFQPSVAVVSSAWPLLDLWTARETPREAIDIELHGRPDHLVIRRTGFIVRCESIAADEALALQSLLEGRRLGETTERFEAEGHDPSLVLAWFSRWTSAGMIADARTD